MKLFLLLLVLVWTFVVVQYPVRRMRESHDAVAACEEKRYYCCSIFEVEQAAFFVKQWGIIV
jgi:hypothetical protein